MKMLHIIYCFSAIKSWFSHKHVHCARNQMGSRNNFYVPIHSIQPGVPSPVNLIETAAEEIRSVLDVIVFVFLLVIVFVFLLVFVRRRER